MSYIDDAIRTEAGINLHRFDGPPWKLRLLHAGMGMATESGEFLDQLKKHLFYGKDLDETNLIEELGDLMWYIAVAASALGVTIEKFQRLNIDKLKARYPERFSEERAENRDLDVERKVLENE